MILLIGNFLSKHGLNPTAIENLATALSSRYEIKTSSDKKKPFFLEFPLGIWAFIVNAMVGRLGLRSPRWYGRSRSHVSDLHPAVGNLIYHTELALPPRYVFCVFVGSDEDLA